MGYPVDSNLRGLARATFQSDIPPWEYDIRAVSLRRRDSNVAGDADAALSGHLAAATAAPGPAWWTWAAASPRIGP